MKDFNKGSRFGGGGGGFKGGFNRGASGGGGFGGAPRGDFSRPKEMHQATCANCGKGCEVPFRPNGKKPVFCKECFTSGKTDGAPSQSFSRPDSAPRPAYRSEGRSEHRPHGNEPRTEDLKPRIEALDAKLNTLIKMVEGLKHTSPAAKEGVAQAVKAALKPAAAAKPKTKLKKGKKPSKK